MLKNYISSVLTLDASIRSANRKLIFHWFQMPIKINISQVAIRTIYQVTGDQKMALATAFSAASCSQLCIAQDIHISPCFIHHALCIFHSLFMYGMCIFVCLSVVWLVELVFIVLYIVVSVQLVCSKWIFGVNYFHQIAMNTHVQHQV